MSEKGEFSQKWTDDCTWCERCNLREGHWWYTNETKRKQMTLCEECARAMGMPDAQPQSAH